MLIIIINLSNCLIRCVSKKSFLSFSYFPWLLKKYAKFVGTLPPPPFCHCYVLQYSSFWNHKAKSYGIKTTSYAHKTTSYAHKTTSYAHKTMLKLYTSAYKSIQKLCSQNYKLRPQNYKLRVQNLQV